ncbi:MAG: hypothetical protein MUP09_00880, partial [Thiovulaceae bacterium]|nr:hypothetical protein [Sulfurimonadaceae bacterium]
DACRTVALVADAAGDTLSLQAGRYRFEVRVHGHVASHFRYGLGDGVSYGLALYGVYMPPIHQSWLTWAKTALGGSDRRQVNGYQLSHRMVTMRPGDPSGPAILRIANMAPGSEPVSGHFKSGQQSVALAAVSYADVSDRVRIDQHDGLLGLRFSGSPRAFVTRQLHLPRGSNTMAYLVSAHADHASIVIDQRSPLQTTSK